MSSLQERKSYLQLWSFTTGPAIDVMKHYFEVKVLNTSSFESFLNVINNMHKLFHQCFPTTPCCYCVTVSLAAPNKKGCLNRSQFDKLYINSGSPMPNHEIMKGSKFDQICLCKYSAKSSVTVNDLDITLFNDIVQHCCSSQINFAWRKSIKDVRNFLAHAGTGYVNKQDFDDNWKTLNTATLGFAGEIGKVCEKMFQTEIVRIRSCSTDELKGMIENSTENQDKMINLLNGLKPIVDECKKTAELVHMKQESHDQQFENLQSVLGQSTREIGEIKHKMNKFDSFMKLMLEEKENCTCDGSKRIKVETHVDNPCWNDENTAKRLCEMTNADVDEKNADKEKFFIQNVENKCIQMELVAFPDVFKSPQSLRKAIKILINQLIDAGEVDTSIPGRMDIEFTIKTPLTKEEMAVAFSVFGGHNNLDESTENGLDLKSKLQDHISVFQTVTTENKTSDNSDSEMDFRPIDDQFVTVKPESISTRYEEIFVNVNNLKCLIKLNGLPNDLNQPESEEVSPDTEGNQLLYLEWTFECPKKWNLSLIVPSITDNITSFPDEFPVDYVYNETTNTFIMHTTAKRFVFRSYSSLEAAVVKFIGKIINVSSIESTEPDEVSASVLIMTKPEEDEHLQSDFDKDVKTDQSILGLKDKIVTCEHCTKDFCCKKCMSKINHIRRLNQALKMKDQTIQRLERALTKREKDMIEEDQSDNDSDYSVGKITLHEDPEEENINTSTAAGIGILEEPEKKKRKTAIICTSDIAKSKDVSESLNTNDSYILVDVKQALQKLAEIPLVDYYLKMYRTYLKDFNQKWTPVNSLRQKSTPPNPTNSKEILKNLSKEKKKRTKLIAKLVDVIYNRNEFTTTDEAYGTDIQFLNVGYPTTKCTYCHTKEAYQISCYSKDYEIFVCNNCVKEHRMKNKNHRYMYQSEILREYKLTNSLEISNDPVMIDLKCMADDIVVILLDDRLCTYNFAGGLINSFSISMHQYWKNRIACVNNYQIAVAEPAHDLIKIITIIAPNTITDVGTPAGTNMTGGITCRMDMLYVAFTDAIRLMDLSGIIQRVVNIPNVDILHSVNNDKMLCVYSKKDSENIMSCLDFTNDSFNDDFDRFPFHPYNVSTDEVGNIIFLEDGVIWQADSDGNNIRIILSPVDVHYEYTKITYNKDLKILFAYYNGNNCVELYRKLE